jgi:hypothetical protein
VEVGALRATVLDRSEPAEGGFHVQGGEGRFLLEAAPGTAVTVRIQRPQPARSDRLDFGDRSTALGAAAVLNQPAEAGISLRGAYLIPVQVQAREAWVSFAASPGAPR